MDTANHTFSSTLSASQCEEILGKLSRMVQPRCRWPNGLSSLGMALIWAWFVWKDSMVLGAAGKHALTVGAAVWGAFAGVQLVNALQQTWLNPKDRLLLLLAENFLARKKELSPSSPPPLRS